MKNWDVMIACNDHRNGHFCGRADAFQMVPRGSHDASMELDGPPVAIRFEREYCRRTGVNHFVRIANNKFAIRSHSEWVGNWCWDSVMMSRDDVRWLCRILKRKQYHCNCAPEMLYRWFNERLN